MYPAYDQQVQDTTAAEGSHHFSLEACMLFSGHQGHTHLHTHILGRLDEKLGQEAGCLLWAPKLSLREEFMHNLKVPAKGLTLEVCCFLTCVLVW